jgi:putative phosphonate metabolism protein
MRHAIYFTPPADDALSRLAARWLGRNAFGGRKIKRDPPAGLTLQEFDALVGPAARYGFHATLKAPFRLAQGSDAGELDVALQRFCLRRDPFAVRLRIGRIGGFFALVADDAGNRHLGELAAAAVEAFEPFRAALTAQEFARRKPEMLTQRQRELLERYGYPYVMEEFRFHMTLTGDVAQAERARTGRAVEAWFGPLLDEPVDISGLARFVEKEPEGMFEVAAMAHFNGGEKAARQVQV